MSKQTVCDNDLCSNTYESLDDEDAMWWIKLGWVDSETSDACSVTCAMAVLDEMQQRQWAVEQAVEVRELVHADSGDFQDETS